MGMEFWREILERKLDSRGSEQGRVTGSCKYKIGHSGSRKDPNFLEYSTTTSFSADPDGGAV